MNGKTSSATTGGSGLVKRLTKETLRGLRKMIPTGTEIILLSTHGKMHPGNLRGVGKVQMIDNDGVIHVRWPDGAEAGLVLGQDRFQALI